LEAELSAKVKSKTLERQLHHKTAQGCEQRTRPSEAASQDHREILVKVGLPVGRSSPYSLAATGGKELEQARAMVNELRQTVPLPYDPTKKLEPHIADAKATERFRGNFHASNKTI
jgi:hypothetical protein